MIEVNNIVKQYGSHLAVDHLSFRVEKGQIYGFLGPNGAGKSTTMNIITGYLASNEGTVVINGHDILEEPEEAKKCIGYLPEIPPLYPDMTVMEYLDFVAGLKKVQKSEKDEILEDIMVKTYLDSVKDRLIKNLSKGYKQRVGLAQAMIGYPEVIILDEPTVGLDPKQIIEIRELIKELAKKQEIELVHTNPHSELIVMGDRDRLKQVFINTIDNAVKYTIKDGRVDIIVSFEEGFIKTVIKDTSNARKNMKNYWPLCRRVCLKKKLLLSWQITVTGKQAAVFPMPT